jgi:hypothetical protein
LLGFEIREFHQGFVAGRIVERFGRARDCI